MKKLAICIPTYNREEYLKELLLSIINETDYKIREKLEICISDNASTDNTSQMIDGIMEEYGITIIYNKNNENIGPDLNYLKAVKIATAEYCWLMGSDDLIKPGSLNYLLNILNENQEVSTMIFNRDECDINMKFIKQSHWLNKNIDKLKINFKKEEEIREYFKNCNSLGGVFSFLSSIIVKRKKWEEINYDDSFTGSAYSHVFILISILFKGNTHMYDSKSIVLCRGENDFFYKNLKQRMFIDYEGYYKLGEEIIKDLNLKKDFFKILKREHSLKKYIYMNAKGLEIDLNKKDILFLEKLGYTPLEIKIMKKSGPKILYAFLNNLKRIIEVIKWK